MGCCIGMRVGARLEVGGLVGYGFFSEKIQTMITWPGTPKNPEPPSFRWFTAKPFLTGVGSGSFLLPSAATDGPFNIEERAVGGGLNAAQVVRIQVVFLSFSGVIFKVVPVGTTGIGQIRDTCPATLRVAAP